jgi:hypothetical protein
MDCTKELCSDNRHRFLHTLWGIRRVVLPLFGPTLVNSEGRAVYVKTLCETDHVQADYQTQFIPTLADFVEAIDEDPDDARRFQHAFRHYARDSEVRELLLSPLAATGALKSLLLTHNSWFLSEIVPRVIGRRPRVRNYEIAPADLFARMRFRLWMDNGTDLPPSARPLQAVRAREP